jgi:SH3-like domain-containing protein
MPVLFNPAATLELQLTDFSCSVGATFWCLNSLGVNITQRALQELMVPGLVSPDDGLLDSSGSTIVRLLRDHFGLAATNMAQVSFDEVASRAGRQPIALGGRRWHVNPATGAATGHWVAVRSFDGQRLILANPGGTGPNFGQQSLDRDDFAQRGSFSAVFIESSGSTGPVGLRFRIAHTDGQGANVRAEPGSASAPVRALREGAGVAGDEHAWRQVTEPGGERGWMANEFLEPVDGAFRVAHSDGQGANLRRQPGTSSDPPIKLLPEGTSLTGDEHAWRHITDADGNAGWVAEEFLSAQS